MEQEVHGDQTLAIDSVLSCDLKRNALILREKELTEQINKAYVTCFLDKPDHSII